MINEYLNSNYTLLPFNPFTNTIPDRPKILNDLPSIDWRDLDLTYRDMVNKKKDHINSLCIEEKLKYLNINNSQELTDFENEAKYKFYLNEIDYDNGFVILSQPTIFKPTIISKNKVVKEITKKPKVKKVKPKIIEKEIEKKVEKEIKIEKEVVILDTKVVNEITTQLKHFDKHYNIMFPCNCDKITDAKEYNRQKKNKSNLRTEYKKHINGLSLRDCKDNSKLTMMVYIIDNIS